MLLYEIICLLFLIIVEKLLSLKCNNGGFRGYQLPEHAKNKIMDIRLNESYEFWDCIKDSDMAKKKHVEFRIDKQGYIYPSGVYDNPDLQCYFIGDSTVECAIVDAENRFCYLAGKMLSEITKKRVNTYNMGYSGLDTNGALRLIVNKAIPGHADVVVISNAISELSSVLTNRETIINVIEGFDKQIPLIKRIKHAFAFLFPCLYVYLGEMRSKTKTKQRILEKKEKQLTTIEKTDILNNIKQKYAAVINICKANDVKLYLCTQQSGFFSNEDSKRMEHLYNTCVHGNIKYQCFVEMLLATNQLIRDLAIENNISLLDMELDVAYTPQIMYDYIHYSDQGSVEVANYIVSKIIQG